MIDSSSSDGSDEASVDAGPGVDSTAADSGTSPGQESGTDSGVDGSCSPEPYDAAFVFTPPSAPRNACAPGQIQALYDACWATGWTTAGCDAFYGDPTNSPCILCMFSDPTASPWGAIIRYPDGLNTANISGCIDLATGDAGPGSCAYEVQALKACEQGSCGSNCPSAQTTAGYDAYERCSSASNTSTCATQYQAAGCQTAYTACQFADFESYFLGIGAIFCSAGASDAGGE